MITDFCDKYDMLPKNGIVLCAVSGGKDSMCLMERLRELAPQYGFEVRCAHFDHRLRGEESDRDRAFVEAYCGERGIPCYVGSADVSCFAKENGLGIEEAAR
ncbi:MAG: ATP-binding protein, partial [Oscillospiraceae bacterium]